jgi:hypothetical protein
MDTIALGQIKSNTGSTCAPPLHLQYDCHCDLLRYCNGYFCDNVVQASFIILCHAGNTAVDGTNQGQLYEVRRVQILTETREHPVE